MRSLFLAVLFALACLSAVAQTSELKVSTGDVLRVIVVGQEGLSGTFTVLTDGTITLPRIGRVAAVGRSIEAIQADVLKGAKRFLVDPEVSVVFELEKQKYVFIVGENVSSGSVPWSPGIHLRELLANVSLPGLPEDYEATLYRGGKKFEEIDLAEVLTAEQSEDNIELRPDDLISILPRRNMRIWVLGEVAGPGEYRVMPGTSLDQVLAIAGGLRRGEYELDELTVQLRRNGEVLTFKGAVGTEEFSQSVMAGDVIVAAHPEVTKVTVAGAVVYPREHSLPAGSSTFFAISRAGGPRENGTLRRVMLYRDGEVSVMDLTKNMPEQPSQGMVVQEGDFIYVPPNDDDYFVLGNVVNPGRRIIKDGFTPRLVDAIGDSGGLTDNGVYRDIVVARAGENGRLEINRYNLDEFFKDGRLDQNPILKTGDVVYVRETKGLNLAEVTRIISSALFLERIFD